MNIDFPEIAERLKQGNLSPDEIVRFREYSSGELYFLYEKYADLLSFGAEWRTQKREDRLEGEKPKSEAELDRLYLTSDLGKAEMTLKYKIKGAESLESILTSLYFQTNKEMQMANREH